MLKKVGRFAAVIIWLVAALLLGVLTRWWFGGGLQWSSAPQPATASEVTPPISSHESAGSSTATDLYQPQGEVALKFVTQARGDFDTLVQLADELRTEDLPSMESDEQFRFLLRRMVELDPQRAMAYARSRNWAGHLGKMALTEWCRVDRDAAIEYLKIHNPSLARAALKKTGDLNASATSLSKCACGSCFAWKHLRVAAS